NECRRFLGDRRGKNTADRIAGDDTISDQNMGALPRAAGPVYAQPDDIFVQNDMLQNNLRTGRSADEADRNAATSSAAAVIDNDRIGDHQLGVRSGHQENANGAT